MHALVAALVPTRARGARSVFYLAQVQSGIDFQVDERFVLHGDEDAALEHYHTAADERGNRCVS